MIIVFLSLCNAYLQYLTTTKRRISFSQRLVGCLSQIIYSNERVSESPNEPTSLSLANELTKFKWNEAYSGEPTIQLLS